jgi:hypothetical protein
LEHKDSYRFRFIIDQKLENFFLDSLLVLFGSGRIDTLNDCSDMQRYVLENNHCSPFQKSWGLPQRGSKNATFLAFIKLYQYLDQYPLLSSKHLVFLRFKKI